GNRDTKTKIEKSQSIREVKRKPKKRRKKRPEKVPFLFYPIQRSIVENFPLSLNSGTWKKRSGDRRRIARTSFDKD
ncbi:hypothetical protein RUM43_005332, partial [Polyplax serrata]